MSAARGAISSAAKLMTEARSMSAVSPRSKFSDGRVLGIIGLASLREVQPRRHGGTEEPPQNASPSGLTRGSRAVGPRCPGRAQGMTRRCEGLRLSWPLRCLFLYSTGRLGHRLVQREALALPMDDPVAQEGEQAV